MGDILPIDRAAREMTSTPRPATTPPHDLAAERAVLASILIATVQDAHGQIAWSRWAWDAANAIVRASDFYHPAHALIFEAMAAMIERGVPLDVVTLAAELTSRQRLSTVGGVQYIGELTDDVPTTAHVQAHAQIVARHARARAMIDAVRSFAARLHRGDDPDALCDRLTGYLTGLAPSTICEARVGDLLDSYVRDLDAAAEGHEDGAVPSGLPDLDRLVRLRPGNLTLLGALPGVGKTALALQIAAYAARSVPVLFVSAELTLPELRDRLLSCEAGVPHDRVLRRALVPEDYALLNAAAPRLDALSLWLEEARSRQWSEVAGIVARHERKRRPRLVVIDHLHQLEARGHESRRVMVEWIVAQAKSLAVRLACPVLLLGALSRQKVEGRLHRLPRAADFRETGMVESLADTVLLMHWEHRFPTRSGDEAPREERLLIVPKQRAGRTGKVALRFREDVQRFDCVAPATWSPREDVEDD